MDSDRDEIDAFDRALQAEAKLSESEIRLLTKEIDEDFRKVTHDECIYRLAAGFLDTAVNSPRDILTSIMSDESITESERRYLQSLEKSIVKEMFPA